MKINHSFNNQVQNRSIFVFILLLAVQFIASAQMPPPGYERTKKMQEEQMKIPFLDRDSISIVDTVMIFDADTYESETRIISSKLSLRDYCFRYLGMGNADILLDGKPHTIVDPNTYEEMTIILNPAGKIDTIPKKQ